MSAESAPPREDPSVAAVERVFDGAGSRVDWPVQHYLGMTLAPHALWICACVTIDDSPIWLIFDNKELEISWCRVPAGVEPLNPGFAQLSAGGHADPAEVLRWATGETADPWALGGSGSGDLAVLDELRRKFQPKMT